MKILAISSFVADGIVGHPLPYHKTVYSIAMSKKWQYKILIPKKNRDNFDDKDWIPCLNSFCTLSHKKWNDKNIFSRLLKIIIRVLYTTFFFN